MKFSQLAHFVEQIEKTSSRLTITHLLAELFKKLNEEEIEKTVYLLQGRLAPLYNDLEFGMAEKMIGRSIVSALQIDKKVYERQFKKFGDLGMTTEYFKKQIRLLDEKDLSILEVYDSLYKLALAAKVGSQDVKVQILAKLITLLDPLSCRYLVRIPIGVLRLGFSDMTVLDAFSWMLKGDKSLRSQIEKAYHVRPDLGLIGKVIKNEGVKGLRYVKPKLFTPILMMKAERLSSAKEIIEKIGRCAIESKYDGFRCITGHTPIYVEDKGYISVKDVRVGDKVLTHNGRFMKVLATNKRNVEGKERVFKLKPYLADSIKISEGHQILVWEKDQVSWRPIEKIKAGDEIVFPRPNLQEFRKDGLINPHLQLSDESGYQKKIPSNRDFYRFLGFWLGDGFTNEFHNTERVGLNFNAKKEVALAQEYKKMISKLLKIPKITESYHRGALILYWRDKPMRIWLSSYFRREWKGKALPQWFAHVSKKEFSAFLKGWIESDGSPTHGGGFKIVTKERDLAAFAQLIGLRHGIIIGIRKIRVHIKKINFTGTYFELILPGTSRYARIEGNYIVVRILRNELIKRDPRLKLYNLQVAGDRSYCSGLVTLHNCQIHKSNDRVEIFSRNLEKVTFMYPDVVEGIKKEIKADEIIFEGEAIGFDPHSGNFLPFQETVQRKRKYGIEEKAKEIPLKLFAFELLYLKGESYLDTPFMERRKKLLTVIKTTGDKFSDVLLTAPEEITEDEKKLELMFDDAVSKGLEGIIAKKLTGVYKPGAREWNWIKFKRSYSAKIDDTIDCLVMGYDYGKGKRTGFGMGAFLVGVYDGKQDKFLTVAKIGTGLSDEEWKELKVKSQKLKVKSKPVLYEVDKMMECDNWISPSIVVEIKADEITKSPVHTAGRKLKASKSGKAFDVDVPGFALRFPRLERFRDDKRPEDVTSLKELEKMFSKQSH